LLAYEWSLWMKRNNKFLEVLKWSLWMKHIKL
jgi:hypothetical protein